MRTSLELRDNIKVVRNEALDSIVAMTKQLGGVINSNGDYRMKFDFAEVTMESYTGNVNINDIIVYYSNNGEFVGFNDYLYEPDAFPTEELVYCLECLEYELAERKGK